MTEKPKSTYTRFYDRKYYPEWLSDRLRYKPKKPKRLTKEVQKARQEKEQGHKNFCNFNKGYACCCKQPTKEEIGKLQFLIFNQKGTIQAEFSYLKPALRYFKAECKLKGCVRDQNTGKMYTAKYFAAKPIKLTVDEKSLLDTIFKNQIGKSYTTFKIVCESYNNLSNSYILKRLKNMYELDVINMNNTNKQVKLTIKGIKYYNEFINRR